jgi:hypothetical protein
VGLKVVTNSNAAPKLRLSSASAGAVSIVTGANGPAHPPAVRGARAPANDPLARVNLVPNVTFGGGFSGNPVTEQHNSRA